MSKFVNGVPGFFNAVDPEESALDADGFVGVDPIYQNYANETDAPLEGEESDEDEASVKDAPSGARSASGAGDGSGKGASSSGAAQVNEAQPGESGDKSPEAADAVKPDAQSAAASVPPESTSPVTPPAPTPPTVQSKKK